jgi:hypothetical protein
MRTYIRSTIIGLLLVIGMFTVVPAFTSAQTVTASSSVSVQIQSLMDQIKALQQQIVTLLHVSGGGTGNATSTVPFPPRPCRPLVRNLLQGMRGDDIKDMQDTLIGQGILTGTSTGFFGEKTREALKHFQAQNGITAVGLVGPQTRDIFNNHCEQRGKGDGRGQMMGTTTMPFPPIPGMPGHDGGDHGWMMGSTTATSTWMRDGKPSDDQSGKHGGGDLMGRIGDAVQKFMPMLGNGFANGSITAVGASTITVQVPGGAPRTILVTSSTQINTVNATSTVTMNTGTFASFAVGQHVAVTGPMNADGTVTASTITIINGVQNF